MADNIYSFRVLVFEESDMFVAQCLEKDIGAQGKDIEELFDHLTATIILEASFMERINKAPKRFFDMWEDGHLDNSFENMPNVSSFDVRMAA